MKTPFQFAAIALFAVSACAQDAQPSNSTQTSADQLQIAVQKICPVTGKTLGSMGEPFKVIVGEQVAFLCCEECRSREIQAAHWKTIQANLAAAQGTCPIMDKPVDETMESAVVNGQQVFVCCPPCIARIQEDVGGSLKKVNASYALFVRKERQIRSDQLHASSQGICPVSGHKLGSMGDPVKVRVGEDEIAFLCCKDCIDKPVDAGHWMTIQNNLANAQRTCPVMGKVVDASMQSTVVNGRRIFVCCPPCIEKILADPEASIAWLDSRIAEEAPPQQDGGNQDRVGPASIKRRGDTTVENPGNGDASPGTL